MKLRCSAKKNDYAGNSLCKKFISGLLAVALLATANISSFAMDSDNFTLFGKCGENATWSFDESTGVLTISGTGNMYKNTPVDQWEYYPLRESVKEVVVEEGITSITVFAFGQREYSQPSAYPNLTKLSLPSSVRSIENYAFSKAGLTSIEFSEGLESIGESAFSYTTKLTSIDLPEGLKTIAPSAFTHSSLTGDLILPQSLNDIGQDSFQFTDITSVNLHEGMSLGGAAFANCNSLKEVTIPKNLTYPGRGEINMVRSNKAFIECKGLETVTILGGGTVKIPLGGGDKENGLAREMFRGCTSLKVIIIKADDISYVEAYDNRGGDILGTFDMTNNPTFYIYKDSTTEATLRNAGYLTDTNVVYIANKSALEEAVKSAVDMDVSQYTAESVDALNKAIEDGKSVIEDEGASQEKADNAVKAIKDAIDGLKYPPADYTAVDEAIAKVPDDLSIYTNETAKAVTAAVEAVDRTKDITEQEIVDGYAKAIEDAVAALELKPLGSVSGTVKAPEANNITVEVSTDGGVVYTTGVANGEFTIPELESGEYEITFTAENCAPRNYNITVKDGNVELSAEIHLYGDINGDGKITTTDVGLANAHAKGIKTLDGYELTVSDVSKDGKVTTADAGAINSHAQGVRTLW